MLTVARSHIVQREECPRLRFLTTDLDGEGYELVPSTVPLIQGTAGHAGLAAYLRTGDLHAGVAAAHADYEEAITSRGFLVQQADAELLHTHREQRWLLEVVLLGWIRQRWPLLASDYEIVIAPEAPWAWELAPGILQPLRMDVVLQHRTTGNLTILDFKWTSTAGEGWVTQHAYSRQTLTYTQALVERAAREWPEADVEGICYEGLIRGSWKKETAKSSPWCGWRIQQTPWCYGYLKGDLRETLQTDYTNRVGYRKIAAWEWATPAQWVDLLEREGKLPELFASTPPLSLPAATRTRRIRQLATAETQWAEHVAEWQMAQEAGLDQAVLEDRLDRFAPQHTERCAKYGSDALCQFAAVCNTPGGWATLAGDERFRRRISHHAAPPPREGDLTTLPSVA